MYVKLFRSMYDGSLATRGPWEALVTFQQLLILADRFGHVDMTPDVIARITTIPPEIIRKGIRELEKPDHDSRRGEHNGVRITLLDPSRAWGWAIVNYEHYRNLRTAEERRAYHRQYMRSRREAAQRQPKPKPKADASPEKSIEIPPWIDADTWHAWVQMRPPKARSHSALAAALRKLEKWRVAGYDANEIIGTSLANGWRGLFAPDKSKNEDIQAPVAGTNRCAYCADTAVGTIAGIAHCARPDHLDAAIAGRR